MLNVTQPAPESFLSAYQAAISYISSSAKSDTVFASVFSRMYINTGWNATIRLSFRDLLTTYYGASPITYFSSPEEAAHEINNDVANATNNRIPSLVSPNMLLLSPLVLVSALYFKGDWKHAFDKDGAGLFLTQDREKSVEMMKLTGMSFPYRNMGAYDVISIPYANEDYCMLIIKPVKRSMDAVAALRDLFDTIDIDRIIEQMSVPRLFDNGKMDITMPRFSVRTDYGLSDAMKELGIQKIFYDADFRGVFQTKNGVYVGYIVHKVFMEVNENGTEAAGAGAVIFADSVPLPSPQFVVDRPFFAVVYNKVHKINMFTAYIGSP